MTRRFLGSFGGTILLVALLVVMVACGGTSPTATPTTAPTPVGAVATAPAVTATTSGATAEPAAQGTTPASASATVTATPAVSSAAAGSAAATPPGVKIPIPPTAERYAIVPETSKAGYEVNENFLGANARFNTAVGTTNAISGDLFIDRAKPSASSIGPITVNINKLTSDESRRDNAIRTRWLESNKYPTATFVATKLEGLPDTPYVDGQELTFKIIGDLTVRTVTKPVTFDAKGKIVGDVFTGTATTQFNMTDFGFDPPSVLGLVKAENGVKLNLQLEAKKAG